MELHEKIFVKFFPSDMAINDFKFKIGLNHDDVEDIDFIDFEDIYYTNVKENDLIGIIRIKKNIEIKKDIINGKYISSEIYIENVYPFENFLKDKKIYVEEKKKIQCQIIIFRMIENPSEEVQLHYILKNGFTICYINNPSEKVQLEAISRNYFSVNYIKNITDEVLIKAIEKNWECIQYIKNPSVKVQLAAIAQDKNSIDFMPFISKEDRKNLLKYINGKK